LTLENVFLWFDVDVELTADLLFRIDDSNGALEVAVTNVDTSVSCWDIFLISLFMAVVGAIVLGAVGGIIGGVIGGSVGGAIIGAAMGSGVGWWTGLIVPAVFAAIEQAKAEGKIAGVVSDPSGQPIFLEVVRIQHAWQIPATDLVIRASAEWIDVVEGELLMGGRADLPPLASTSVEIITETSVSSWAIDQKVIDAYRKSAPASNDRVALDEQMRLHAFTIICRAQASDLMEPPFEMDWTVDSHPVGKGSFVRIEMVPRIQLSPGGYYVHVDRTMHLVGSDGKKVKSVTMTSSQFVDRNTPEIAWEELLSQAGITSPRRAFWAGDFFPVHLMIRDVLGQSAEATRRVGGVVLEAGMEGVKDLGLPDWLIPDVDLADLLSGTTEPRPRPSAVLWERLGGTTVRRLDGTAPYRYPSLARNLPATQRIHRLPSDRR
jgi:hypothetical protein